MYNYLFICAKKKRVFLETASCCGRLITAQGNKVIAKNNLGARFPANVQKHTHSHTDTHVHSVPTQ